MYRRVQARSRGGRWAGLSRRSQPRGDQEQGGALVLGLRVGPLLLQLFPNGGATDIVFMTLFCIAAGTAIAWCCGRCGMPDGRCHNILLFWRRSTAASVFRVGAYFEVSLFCPPFSHSSQSLIGLIASVVSLPIYVFGSHQCFTSGNPAIFCFLERKAWSQNPLCHRLSKQMTEQNRLK